MCVSLTKFFMSSKSHLWPQPSWRVVSRGLALFGTLLPSWRLHMLLRRFLCFLDSSPSLTSEMYVCSHCLTSYFLLSFPVQAWPAKYQVLCVSSGSTTLSRSLTDPLSSPGGPEWQGANKPAFWGSRKGGARPFVQEHEDRTSFSRGCRRRTDWRSQSDSWLSFLERIT